MTDINEILEDVLTGYKEFNYVTNGNHIHVFLKDYRNIMIILKIEDDRFYMGRSQSSNAEYTSGLTEVEELELLEMSTPIHWYKDLSITRENIVAILDEFLEYAQSEKDRINATAISNSTHITKP